MPTTLPADDAAAVPGVAPRPAEGPRFVVVVPPFAGVDRPSLGAHIVAQVAVAAGWPAFVDYANLRFAARIGVAAYQRLCHHATRDLVGERIFVPACYPGEVAALDGGAAADLARTLGDAAIDLAALQAHALAWADEEAARLAASPARLIGFSSTFEQTLACIALAGRVRRLAPDKRLVIGGANVDGTMADGMHALAPVFDHVFAGESEASLAAFLAALDRGETPPPIVRGTPSFSLDALPSPDYADYRAQVEAAVALAVEDRCIPYESSRGCWWGAKHHCTFCGLNAQGMAYRQKSPGKVAAELSALADADPGARVVMVDNIMPHGYFRTLLPTLAARETPLDLFYEQKANLDHARMALLRAAGVTRIQPGIEALDDRVLRLMDKGTSLRVNLDCLRWARLFGIDAAWNLLVDFPGEPEDALARTAALVPLIAHLQPPASVSPLSIDRFSPYFDRAAEYGIADVRPLPAYAAVHPGRGDGSSIAYHFTGRYDSGWRRRPDLGATLRGAVDAWHAAWRDAEAVPLLAVVMPAPGRYLMIDTRPCAVVPVAALDLPEAVACLTGRGDRRTLAVAEARGWVWRSGDQALPLAIAGDPVLAAVGAI